MPFVFVTVAVFVSVWVQHGAAQEVTLPRAEDLKVDSFEEETFGLTRDEVKLLLKDLKVCSFDEITSELTSDELKLLKEYTTDRFFAVRDFYSHLTMHVHADRTFGTQDYPNMTYSSEITYMADGPVRLRVEETVTKSRSYRDNYSAPKGRRVFLAYEDGSIGARAEDSKSDLVVARMNRDSLAAPGVIVRAPFEANGAPLDAFFSTHEGLNYRITSVSIDDVGQGDGVVVTSQCDLNKYEFKFMRPSWVLTSYSIRSRKHSYSTEGRITYVRRGDESMPLMSEMRSWDERGDARQIADVKEYRVEDIIPGPVPAEEFTPQAIGVNARFPTERSPWWWLVGLFAGILLIAAGVLVRTRGDRSNPG